MGIQTGFCQLGIWIVCIHLVFRGVGSKSKYGEKCTAHVDCIDSHYLSCKRVGGSTICQCKPGLVWAPIVIGPHKGTKWCLRAKGKDCSRRETPHEDCVTGYCFMDGEVSRCEEALNSGPLSPSPSTLHLIILLIPLALATYF